MSVLTVGYPGGRTRRRWLDNYQELKHAVETICELNHHLLRPDAATRKPRRKPHD